MGEAYREGRTTGHFFREKVNETKGVMSNRRKENLDHML